MAEALQRPSGEVSVRYTRPESLVPPLAMDRMIMQTPYEEVLAAIVLDTKLNLRFIRTGSRAEGARVALVSVEPLLAAKHWDITLTWDADGLSIEARDRDEPGAKTFSSYS